MRVCCFFSIFLLLWGFALTGHPHQVRAVYPPGGVQGRGGRKTAWRTPAVENVVTQLHSTRIHVSATRKSANGDSSGGSSTTEIHASLKSDFQSRIMDVRSTAPKAQAQNRKLTGVLPVVYHDTELLTMFFASCKATLSPETFEAVWLVAMDREVPYFVDVLRNASDFMDTSHFKVLAESDVVPNYYEGHGWLKQQDIKLAIARIIPTEFYLVLDADTVCLDSTAQSLKACIEYPADESHGVIRTAMRDSNHHAVLEGYHNNTAALFDLPNDLGNIYKWLDYTPQILSTEVVMKVGGWLEEKDPEHRDWIKIISKTGRPSDPRFFRNMSGKGVFWTEFMLYQLGAQTVDLWNSYHIEEERCDNDAAVSECLCMLRTYVGDSSSLQRVIEANNADDSPPVIFITIADDSFVNNPNELRRVRELLGMSW